MPSPPRPGPRQYPMPMPFGWFQVAWSDEVPVGTSVPLYYFGRHLVAWRDESGEAHVWDAFCPHLGAHLGHGGKVEGDPEAASPSEEVQVIHAAIE